MSMKDMNPTNDTVLSVSDLVVRFESGGRQSKKKIVRAVDGVSFEIVRGEIVALVGESGCGKSTIAMAVMRLIKPTSGQIISDGLDLATIHGRALQRARRRIQMIFQDPFGSLDPRQTVMEAVSEPLTIHKVGNSAGERKELVFEALRMAQLNPRVVRRSTTTCGDRFGNGPEPRTCGRGRASFDVGRFGPRWNFAPHDGFA